MGLVATQRAAAEEPEAPPIHIGVDIGQKQDPTAIVLAEVLTRESGRIASGPGYRDTSGVYHAGYSAPVLEPVYHVRLMQRLPLGTPYADVAQRIAGIITADQLQARMRHVLIDATGVGQPVYEMIRDVILAGFAQRQQPYRRYVDVRPITFTHGGAYDQASGRMGKAYLVSRLQRLIQTHCIVLPKHHPEAEAMFAEIQNYDIHVDQDGKDTYGAFKTGTHDDLVTALGLAVLEDHGAHSVSYFTWPH